MDARQHIKEVRTYIADIPVLLWRFLQDAEPQTEEAYSHYESVRAARDEFRKLERKYESTFAAITDGLPDDDEFVPLERVTEHPHWQRVKRVAEEM